MTLILCPSMSLSLSFPNSISPRNHNNDFSTNPLMKNKPMKLTPSNIYPFTNKFSILSATHVVFCSRIDKFDDFSVNNLTQSEHETVELLNKPSPVPNRNGSSSEVEEDSKVEALEPFLKFFKGSDSLEEKGDNGVVKFCEESENEGEVEEDKKVNYDEYYEPKPGDFVVGVVIGGNEIKLSVDVGAKLPGTMLTKEVLPLYGKEMEYLFFDGEKNSVVEGRMGIMRNDDIINRVMVKGETVVEIGTILFAEVLGRTLTGRPLLSSRRLFRRIAWHRLRQIKQLNEPIQVRITEWNAKGLLTRIEGLRAFLPKAELVRRVNSFTELKETVGHCIHVQIMEVDETKNNVILSEKEAWEKLYLQEGTLLEGTVKKILPYGAQVRIGETNRSGLLHSSNITRARVTSIGDILSVDEKVKVLVVKSAFPEKISLSIADLESEPGLFLSNKERVFVEAEMMAKKYKEKKLPPAFITQRLEPHSNSSFPFENEALYANWKWFKFEK